MSQSEDSILYIPLKRYANISLNLPNIMKIKSNVSIIPYFRYNSINETNIVSIILSIEKLYDHLYQSSSSGNQSQHLEYEKNLIGIIGSDYENIDLINSKLDFYIDRLNLGFFANDYEEIKNNFYLFACYGLAKLIKALNSKSESLKNNCKNMLWFLNMHQPIKLCLFVIYNKIQTSNLFITFFTDFMRYGEIEPLKNIIESFYSQYVINIPGEINAQLVKFYIKLIQNSDRFNQTLFLLDNNYEMHKESETNIIISLIPNAIFRISKLLDLNGKVLLGGAIAISKYCIDFKTKIGLAKFMFTLRHEIAHKKWLIYGSKNRYTVRSPETNIGGFTVNMELIILDTE